MWRSGICSRRNKIPEILSSENETRKIPERPFIPFGSCGAVKNCLFYSPFKNAGGGRKKAWHGFFYTSFFRSRSRKAQREKEAGRKRDRTVQNSHKAPQNTQSIFQNISIRRRSLRRTRHKEEGILCGFVSRLSATKLRSKNSLACGAGNF